MDLLTDVSAWVGLATLTALEGATLSLDLAGKQATLTPSGGTAVVLTLTAIAEKDWPHECPTNYASTIVEAFTVAPDPLDVGSVSLPAPRLASGCGSSTKEVVISGTVTSGLGRFVFVKLN